MNDFLKIHQEARERMMCDMTGGEFEEHLVRVAQERAVHGCALALLPFAELADWIDVNHPEHAAPANEVQIESWPYTISLRVLHRARDAHRALTF